MPDDLITKKELLALTGISYGQLYRWKRKGLIPEEWFIHKATYTGQETFFPRGPILARVARIKDLKEDASLDALADLFSPNTADIAVTTAAALTRQLVSPAVLAIYQEACGETERLTFTELLYLTVVDTPLQTGEIPRDEGLLLLHTLLEQSPMEQEQPGDVLLLRKLGVTVCGLVPSGTGVFDHGTRLVARLHLPDYIEALKRRLLSGEGS